MAGAAPGTDGSYLCIWSQAAIEAQLAGGPVAQPLGCGSLRLVKARFNVGPCELLDVLPGSLIEVGPNRKRTGNRLADLDGFGRLHGMIADPQGRYVTANIFAPGGGYVGIIDTRTKGMQVTAPATAFVGRNAQGRRLIGRVVGDYDDAALGDLTPNGLCKENGSITGLDGAAGGRPNNLIIYPIPSSGGRSYITMGGGGLLVADTSQTPMTIVGEYGNQVINGAGCGGVEVGGTIWLNAGVAASPAGATWSTFTMYTIDDFAFGSDGAAQPENTPVADLIYVDPGKHRHWR